MSSLYVLRDTLTKEEPGLGLLPATVFGARGSKVMKWVQEGTGFMSW